MTTNDATQLAERARKERWAPVLDRFLGAHHSFRQADDAERTRGIDRVSSGAGGRSATIEYRCDERAHHSGSVFIEVLRAGANIVVGTDATWILYLIAPRKLLVFRTARLCRALGGWAPRCRIRPAAGGAMGLLVSTPIAELAAERVVRLDQPDPDGHAFLLEGHAP